MDKTQNRYKSKVLWASLGALILFILKNLLKFDIDEGLFNQFIDILLITLTGFGILNNPTSKSNF